jgi:predicted Zn finger-like uncharacterized protein
MIVACPQCQSKYKLDETKLAGKTQVSLRCTKCNINFPVQLAAAGGSPEDTAARAGSAPPEATRLAGGGPAVELPADKRVALSATHGPHKGTVFVLDKPRVVLGRAGADINIDDPEISRKHCALEVRGAYAMLLDLGSTNGTYVDEQRIESYELEHLGEFRIGSTTLMFTITNKN